MLWTILNYCFVQGTGYYELVCVQSESVCSVKLMLNLQDAILHHEAGGIIDLVSSFNTAYRDTVPCFMVHSCIVWISLRCHTRLTPYTMLFKKIDSSKVSREEYLVFRIIWGLEKLDLHFCRQEKFTVDQSLTSRKTVL